MKYLLLLLYLELGKVLKAIAMSSYLMPCFGNRLNAFRVSFGIPARDKEGSFYAIFVQQL
jgi:hypothetical protein